MVGVQCALPSRELWNDCGAASTALMSLTRQLERFAAGDGLGGRSVTEAAWQFHALCEGLASRARDPGFGRDSENDGALRSPRSFAASPVPQWPPRTRAGNTGAT